ncbi:hypothetical protein SDC9_136900 [bioreactor metagenome]|uniref:Uncharacterized protein n=1 Tax=bioreactor metagenome TaxID=1076179 RepID=A0A645DL44_9ZZZZ
MLLGSGGQAADARADVNAALIEVFLGQVESGILQSLPGGMNAELGVAIGPAHFLGIRKSRGRVEVFHFRRDLGVKLGGVESRDTVYATFSCEEILPVSFKVGAYRGDDTHAGNDYSAFGPIARHKK